MKFLCPTCPNAFGSSRQLSLHQRNCDFSATQTNDNDREDGQDDQDDLSDDSDVLTLDEEIPDLSPTSTYNVDKLLKLTSLDKVGHVSTAIAPFPY